MKRGKKNRGLSGGAGASDFRGASAGAGSPGLPGGRRAEGAGDWHPPGAVFQGTVRGERGAPSVSTARSLQSRASSIMACSLMMLLGGGMLTWYYTTAASRQSRAKRSAESAVSRHAQGEMPLPALEGFNSVKTSEGPTPQPPPNPSLDVPTPVVDPTPDATAFLKPTQLPLAQSPWGPSHVAYGGGARKSAQQLAEERLLAGAAFARESGSRGARASSSAAYVERGDAADPDAANAGTMVTTGAGQGVAPQDANANIADLGTLLRPTAIASVRARVLPTQRFLLGKGAFIDCTLETAIDSTLPGMTTCITATDTFSADGTVVLLERGTKLIGETRGQVQQGVARVFVLWAEARTPTGIVVPLDSPGTDELGRSGLAGEVHRHFWDRFGAAILISTLDGAVQAAVESSGRGGGAIIYNPSTSESVVTDILKSTVNIPPTINKRNGDRIQVFVARDLDFRSVYELRAVRTGR